MSDLLLKIVEQTSLQKRITVNFTSADLHKEEPSYDLPIAHGILVASGHVQDEITKSLVVGELALDGKVRPITGILPHTLMARIQILAEIFIPKENEQEAAIVNKITIFPTSRLLSLLNNLFQTALITPTKHIPLTKLFKDGVYEWDMSDIRG